MLKVRVMPCPCTGGTLCRACSHMCGTDAVLQDCSVSKSVSWPWAHEQQYICNSLVVQLCRYSKKHSQGGSGTRLLAASCQLMT
jgi:hypothetical protein